MNHLMGMAHNLSTPKRVGCSLDNFSSSVTEIYQVGINILLVIRDSCSFEVLTNLTKEIISNLEKAEVTGQPVAETLSAAKTEQKPMRIHSLVLQNIRTTLSNLQSLTIQLLNSIQSLEKPEGDGLGIILHRTAVDIVAGIRNMYKLTTEFLIEIATLFALEEGGCMLPQLKFKTSTDGQKDENIWEAPPANPLWPEQAGTLNSLVETLTSVESFGKVECDWYFNFFVLILNFRFILSKVFHYNISFLYYSREITSKIIRKISRSTW